MCAARLSRPRTGMRTRPRSKVTRKGRKVIKHILGAAICIAVATSAAGQVPPDWQRAVADYRVAIIAAESGRPNAIERAFDAVSIVRDTLLQGSVLESLGDDAFAQLVSQTARRDHQPTRDGIRAARPGV